MKINYKRSMKALFPAIALAISIGSVQAQEKQPIKIAFPVFLSTAAAGTFGEPEKNAAEIVVQALNEGTFPAPYKEHKGINGRLIELIYIDEATDAVTEYRNAVERDKVEAVIGYTSSGNCKAIAPVAEEMKTPTVLVDCGTNQIFESVVKDPKYLFRTGPIQTTDAIGAARYFKDEGIDVSRVAGINANYAFGQDNWNDFSAALKVIFPSSSVATSQFPKLGAGQYGAEISALMTSRPSVIFSSLWGGDVDAFVLQGQPRGIFARTPVMLTCGEPSAMTLGSKFPAGVIIGARGPYSYFAPDNELSRWFRSAYTEKFGKEPTYAAWKMVQAILGLKSAWEKNGPVSDKEAAVAAFKGLTFESPSGTVEMAIGKGHQAIQGVSFAKIDHDKDGKVILSNRRDYSASCVNPPEGVPVDEWIKAGFPQAKCD